MSIVAQVSSVAYGHSVFSFLISLSHIYLLFGIVLWQSLLMMEEIQPHTSQINNPKYAVVIKKACFAWDQDLLIQNIGLLDVQITGIAPRDSNNGFKTSLPNLTNACIIALYRWLFCWNILTFANLQFFMAIIFSSCKWKNQW